MAYAADLKSAARKGMRVQVPQGPPPPADQVQAVHVAIIVETRDIAPMAPLRMRTRSRSRHPGLSKLGSTLVPLALLSCSVFTTPTHVVVLHTSSADHAFSEEGTNLNINHWQLDSSQPGLERGFFVVKSDLEWHQHWGDTDTTKVPQLPNDLAFSKEMLLIASPSDADAVTTEVRSVVVTEQAVHAYVTESTPGTDCAAPDKDRSSHDLARVPMVDGKDVIFHVETAPGDPCGKAPEARITCRSDETKTFQEKLSADPGTKVSCIVGSFASPRPIIDLTWTFSTLPLGATSKMVVGNRGMGVTFTPDVFGTYGLQVEVLDDLQRRGSATTQLDVTPKQPLVLQMIWTKFDPNDDPATFPRVQLRALTLNADGSMVAPGATPVMPPPGPAGAVRSGPMPGAFGAPPISWDSKGACTIDGAVSFCKATSTGFSTVMTIDPKTAGLFAVGVHYTDERVKGQPVACVRVYRVGTLVEDLCDSTAHKDDTWWQVGVIESDTGKTVQTVATERVAAETKAAADAKAAASSKATTDAKLIADAKAAAAARAAGAAAPPAGSARPSPSGKPSIPPAAPSAPPKK
jgi:hypothetical protein